MTGLPYTTVADYVTRAQRAGVGWPLPDDLDDGALETRLFAQAARPTFAVQRPPPDWSEVHRELRRKGVTLQLLHLEYTERHPDWYQYTQFVEWYRRREKRIDVVMASSTRPARNVRLGGANVAHRRRHDWRRQRGAALRRGDGAVPASRSLTSPNDWAFAEGNYQLGALQATTKW